MTCPDLPLTRYSAQTEALCVYTHNPPEKFDIGELGIFQWCTAMTGLTNVESVYVST